MSPWEVSALDATLASVDAGPAGVSRTGAPTRIGRFVVLRKLGEGGMGVVYAAYDNELDRRVAIKLVRGALAESEQSRARIRREAQAMARLSHPNVVQIYEVGEFQDQLFVAMEFITGETLAAWAGAEGRAWREVLDAYIDAARGLAAAHGAGLVHRDFKPDNVLVGDDGRARVLDFGIARSTRGDGDGDAPPAEDGAPLDRASVDMLATPLTFTGALMGTPAYMSPEQFLRRPTDARSDQFSLCVSLYEGLHGVRPFAGKTLAELMIAVTSGDSRPPPSESPVPGWVNQVIERGLAIEPDDRWPSIDALIEALQRDPIRARRRLLQRLSLLALVLAVVAGLAWFAARQTEAARVARAQEEEARAQEAQAQRERDAAYERATLDAIRSRDIARLHVAETLTATDPTMAAAFLLDTEDAAHTRGFASTALQVLNAPLSAAILRGHTKPIWSVAYSPDGRLIATGAADGDIRVWSIDGTRAPVVLAGHDDTVHALEFSPDSARLVSASRDKTARLWTLDRDGSPECPSTVLRGHEKTIWRARFDPAGRRIVTASADGSARIWPGSSHCDGAIEASATLLKKSNVWYAEFSPDGHRVVAGHTGGVTIWDLASPGEPVSVMTQPSGAVYTARYDNTGRRVVTASTDKLARVYTLDEHGAPVGDPIVLRGHTDAVNRALFTGDGRRVVTASADKTARVWDLSGETPRDVVLRGHTGGLLSLSASADGRLVATSSDDGTARVWDALDGMQLATLRGHRRRVFQVRFNPQGTGLATVSHDMTARLWRLDNGPPRTIRAISEKPGRAHVWEGEPFGMLTVTPDGTFSRWNPAVMRDPNSPAPLKVAQLRVPDAHLSRVFPLSSGDTIVTGSYEGDIWLWPSSVLSPRQAAGTDDPPYRPLTRLDGQIYAVTLSQDDSLLAAADREGLIHVWALPEDPLDRATPIPMVALRDHVVRGLSSGVMMLAFTEGVLVSVGYDGFLRVWDEAPLRAALASGAKTVPPTREANLEPRGALTSGALLPHDKARVLVASNLGNVWLHALDSSERAPPIQAHSDAVNVIAVSPDGRRFVTGGSDGTARVWSTQKPTDPIELSSEGISVYAVAFSPDSRTIVTGTTFGKIHIWSHTGELLAQLGLGDRLYDVWFSPDGTTLSATDKQGFIRTVRLGDTLEPEVLRRRLRARTGVCVPAALRVEHTARSPEEARTEFARCVARARRGE